MKHLLLLFVVVIGGAVAASGQLGGASPVNSKPQMLMLPDDPQHATQTPLAAERDLIGRFSETVAHGERPLWEVMPVPKVTPLGDIARAYRKEHALLPKAVMTWVN